MKSYLTLLLLFVISVQPGCVPPMGGGGGGNDQGGGGQVNQNDNDGGVPSDNQSRNDNSATVNENAANDNRSANDNAPASDNTSANTNDSATDNGSMSGGNSNDNATDNGGGGNSGGDTPMTFRLDGMWDDDGRQIAIVQTGLQVEANFTSDFICDLEDGVVPAGMNSTPGAMVETTSLDFRGQLSGMEDVRVGDIINGETSICRSGYDAGDPLGNGIFLGNLTLTVLSVDLLSGGWSLDEDGDGETDIGGTITVTRQP